MGIVNGVLQVSYSAVGVQNSTTAVGTNSTMNGLVVRAALPASTTAVGTVAATSTGDITLISSVATSIYVFAYDITVQSTANVQVRLLSGSTVEVWRTILGANSTTAIAAGNIDRDRMFVSPPAYLFRTGAGLPLVYAKGASSAANGLTSYALAYWTE